MAMSRRGRRPVLQLDDVSSSHQSKHQGFTLSQSEDKKHALASNPLLSLVGQYNSDSSSDEDDEKSDEEFEDGRSGHLEEKKTDAAEEKIQEPEAVAEQSKASELPAAASPKEILHSEPTAVGQPPQPPQQSDLGSSIDSEVASFLAEIESISMGPSGDDKAESKHIVTADSSQNSEADFGFIPKPDASAVMTTEENIDGRIRSFPDDVKNEEKNRLSSSTSAYQSMFVKGASEFVKQEKEEDKKSDEKETEEELPEEPVSEWQMVQDDATQYYYYWNIVTNVVTWEIPPGYTQFLLLYKEYEERLAKIPAEKLQKLKERKYKLENELNQVSSPASSFSTASKSKSSKHKREKHRKDVEIGPQLPSAQHVEIGPQLPSTQLVEIGPQLPSAQHVEIGPQLPSAQHVEIGPQLPSAQHVEIGPQLPSAQHVEIGPQLPSAQHVEIGPQLPPGQNVQIGPQLHPPQNPEIGLKLPSLQLVENGSHPHSPPAHRVEIGPHLPECCHADSVDQGEDTDKDKSTDLAADSFAEEVAELKNLIASDSAIDSTSAPVSAEVEAIFDEALSALAEISSNQANPVVTSSSTEDTSPPGPPESSTDNAESAPLVESSVPTSTVNSSKSSSPVSVDADSQFSAVTTTSASTAVVSSSSVMSVTPNRDMDAVDSVVGNGEAVVTNSDVQDDSINNEEEEDDFDMDFDDIDDLDRALEKALEKKLEKKKAELEKLESKAPSEGLVSTDLSLVPSSSELPQSLSQSEASREVTATQSASEPVSLVVTQAARSISPSELESAVSSSVKTSVEPGSISALATLKTTELESSVSNSITREEGMAESSEVKSPLSSKRSAVASSTKDDESESLEPIVKKARLVAYDAPETDDESMDTTYEVSTTPAVSTQSVNGLDSAVDILPTPPPERADNLAEIQEMADTAIAKLAFLDITSDGLSPLQISLIQLQTRLNDWQEGGLIGEYFYQRLKEANAILKQYESRAVPPGWTCQWDRIAHLPASSNHVETKLLDIFDWISRGNFRRYFYINTYSGETQWDYPDNAIDSSQAAGDRKSRKGKHAKKKKVRLIGPEPDSAARTETTSSELGEASGFHSVGVDEDLDGVAMTEEDTENNSTQVSREATEGQPSVTSTAPENGLGIQSSLQALFPGEPLPPGTELLLGLPPPPPPPLPPDEMPSTTDDAYVCADDSSDESINKEEEEKDEKRRVELQTIDPEIDGEEMVEEEEEGGEKEDVKVEEEDLPQVAEDPAVISRPPQLRFPATASLPGSSSALAGNTPGYEALSSHPAAWNGGSAYLQPDSASGVVASSAIVSSPKPGSPKAEDHAQSAGSPAPAGEATSSSTTDHHKHDKHKKKKKEKLGSHTMSLKKKGVSSLVQKWQKVKKEVEQEERASEQRQMAIRMQLEEWKKENS